MASATNQDTDEDLQQRLITIIKYLFTKNSKGIFGVPKNFLSTTKIYLARFYKATTKMLGYYLSKFKCKNGIMFKIK
jgi:hypothetical protein